MIDWMVFGDQYPQRTVFRLYKREAPGNAKRFLGRLRQGVRGAVSALSALDCLILLIRAYNILSVFIRITVNINRQGEIEIGAFPLLAVHGNGPAH
ncbi:hypothetical protein D3C86_1639880 [compost metagenome]